VAEAYQKAIEDSKLDAIGRSDVDAFKSRNQRRPNMVVTVESKLEVSPEFELPRSKKCRFKRPNWDGSH